MKRELFEMQYFETYYFSNIVNNLLRDPYSYLRHLEEFFGDLNYKSFLVPFPKTSRLHNFISWAIDSINYKDLDDQEINRIRNNENKLWVEIAYSHYGFNFESFDKYLEESGVLREKVDEDNIVDYLQDQLLYGPYEDLLDKISDEVFFILFLNRELLQNLNELISHRIVNKKLNELDEEDLPYFEKDGRVKRVKIPRWVRKAVFFRDRGRCTNPNCCKDLTGIFNITNKENYDHIIPLAQGGINDITNIQLLCENCNKSKKHNLEAVSRHYEKWY